MSTNDRLNCSVTYQLIFLATFLISYKRKEFGLCFEIYVYTNFNWELKKPSLRPRVAKGGHGGALRGEGGGV